MISMSIVKNARDGRRLKMQVCPDCRARTLQANYVKPSKLNGGNTSVGRICMRCGYLEAFPEKFEDGGRHLNLDRLGSTAGRGVLPVPSQVGD